MGRGCVVASGELRRKVGIRMLVAQQRGNGKSEKRWERVVANTGTRGRELQKREGCNPRGLCQRIFLWIPSVPSISMAVFSSQRRRECGCHPTQKYIVQVSPWVDISDVSCNSWVLDSPPSSYLLWSNGIECSTPGTFLKSGGREAMISG